MTKLQSWGQLHDCQELGTVRTRDHRGVSGGDFKVMEQFCVLTVVVVTQIYTDEMQYNYAYLLPMSISQFCYCA